MLKFLHTSNIVTHALCELQPNYNFVCVCVCVREREWEIIG